MSNGMDGSESEIPDESIVDDSEDGSEVEEMRRQKAMSFLLASEESDEEDYDKDEE